MLANKGGHTLLESVKAIAPIRGFLTARMPELAQLPDHIDSYERLHAYSLEHGEHFWSVMARQRLTWFQDFRQVTSGQFGDPNVNVKWFLDGKINVSVNCVDRHYAANPHKVALIWEKDEANTHENVTYEQLYKLMNRFANMLKAHGIGRGDRVAIYMPCCAMAAAAMLACTRLGVIHSVVFAGFSADALASRINDSKCCAVITANQGVRGGRAIELKKTVDQALEQCAEAGVRHVFVYMRTEAKFEAHASGRDIVIDQVLDQYETECEPEVMDADDPLFMLYTSGSTGKPKGLVHTNAGYLLTAAVTQQLVFDYDAGSGDVFGCLADVGWITGHSYVVYGPLCNGGTTVLFESTPIYPDAGRYWETVQRLRITQLYLAPTSIRLLIKYGDEWVTKYDRSSLKCLGSVGEPINVEAWRWYHDIVGEKRCLIADTWWQTETGGHAISPTPCNLTNVNKPGMAMRPFLGINPVLLDTNGVELPRANSSGILCIKQSWPGIARTIYGDHQRYIDTYFKPFPGYFLTGDGATTDQDGFFTITGRIDDVINVSGHRIGTAEIEDCLNKHAEVAESAVVGYPHSLYGEGVYAFVTLKDSSSTPQDKLISELKLAVKNHLAAYAIPHRFLITAHLPKTRSGKIMRRLLRKIAEGRHDELGDTSTLADPQVVDDLIHMHTLETARLEKQLK